MQGFNSLDRHCADDFGVHLYPPLDEIRPRVVSLCKICTVLYPQRRPARDVFVLRTKSGQKRTCPIVSHHLARVVTMLVGGRVGTGRGQVDVA